MGSRDDTDGKGISRLTIQHAHNSSRKGNLLVQEQDEHQVRKLKDDTGLDHVRERLVISKGTRNWGRYTR